MASSNNSVHKALIKRIRRRLKDIDNAIFVLKREETVLKTLYREVMFIQDEKEGKVRTDILNYKKDYQRKPKEESKPAITETKVPKSETVKANYEIKTDIFGFGKFDKNGRLIKKKREPGNYSNSQQSKYLDEVDEELKNSNQ